AALAPPTFSFFFQAEDGIRDGHVTGVQTCVFRSSGCRSNVIRTLWSPRAPARRAISASTAWCPRWTPSKVPIVATAPLIPPPPQIGRASCRERVPPPVGGASRKKRESDRD